MRIFKKEGYFLQGDATFDMEWAGFLKDKGCIGNDFKKDILSKFHQDKYYNVKDFWCIITPLKTNKCIGLYNLQYDNDRFVNQWYSVPLLVFEDKTIMNLYHSDSLLMTQAMYEFEKKYHKNFTKKDLMKISDYFLQGEISHHHQINPFH